jgi:dTDP-4-amino-4,6-dideoxygalactose transaminase
VESFSAAERVASASPRPVRDDFLVFGAPLIGQEEIDEVVDTLRSGWIGFGPKCIAFENQFAEYVQTKYAISVGSCTAGLHLVLLVSGIGPGDEVVTTPLTFASTVNAIELVGARPVLVDVDPETQNMSPDAFAAAISPRTRAVIPVHMAGRPCDMDGITAVAARHGISVIDDAAHAVEAWSQGKKIGSRGDFSVFSFYATKNLTTAEGGMVATADPAAAERLRRLRLHGLSTEAWGRYSKDGSPSYHVVEPGYKYNMTDIQASLGLHQLNRLEQNLRVRDSLWAMYDAAFEPLDIFDLPAPTRLGDRHARHLYTVGVRSSRAQARDELATALRSENIGTGVHFVPVHLHPYYSDKYGFREGMFPNAEHIGRTTLSLPMSAKLSERDIADVIEAVQRAYFGTGSDPLEFEARAVAVASRDVTV